MISAAANELGASGRHLDGPGAAAVARGVRTPRRLLISRPLPQSALRQHLTPNGAPALAGAGSRRPPSLPLHYARGACDPRPWPPASWPRSRHASSPASTRPAQESSRCGTAASRSSRPILSPRPGRNPRPRVLCERRQTSPTPYAYELGNKKSLVSDVQRRITYNTTATPDVSAGRQAGDLITLLGDVRGACRDVGWRRE